MREKLLYIQYLRGIAALLVVVQHARYPQPWLENPLLGTNLGSAGVSIFFVISGFVMYYASRNEPPAEFVRRRIVRIVPIYWIFTTLAALRAVVAWRDLGVGWTDFIVYYLASLFFVPWPDPTTPKSILPMLVPGWTLNYEMFFYLLFAIGIATRKLVPFLILALGGLAAIGLVAAPEGRFAAFYTREILLQFLAGVLIARAFVAGAPFAPLWPALPAGAGLLVWASFVDWEGQIPWGWLGVGAILVVIGTLAAERQAGGWHSRTFAAIGDASFSIYLSHYLVLGPLRRAVHAIGLSGLAEFTVLMASGLVVSTLVGIACYRLVEKPLITIGHRWTKSVAARFGRGPAAA